MREIEDRALEALLIRTLAEHADEIPFSLTSDVVRARLEDRGRRRRRVLPGRRIVLLGLAAVLLLPIGAFVGGLLRTELGPRITAPSPAVTALPQPTQLPSPEVTWTPIAPVADPYQALVVRYEGEDAVIVAVRGDRQERVVASIPMLDRRLGLLVPSPDGWLAMLYRDGWEFLDLRDPGGAPRPFTISETAIGFSWHPDGRFAAWDESGVVTLIDPDTGAETQLTVRGPLGDVVGWTADGSAMLARGDGGDSIYGRGERVTDPAWRVIRLDGGPDDGAVPELDLGLVRSAHFGRGGARLQLCDPPQQDSSAPGNDDRRDCPDEPIGAVVGEAPDGSVTTWYGDELAPDDVDDASFGGDGTAMWLLLDRRVGGRQFALARVDAPGTAQVVAASGLPAAGYDPFRIVGVAPDDSLLVVDAAGLVLVEPITGRATAIDGQFLAFIPSVTADTWAGEPFRPFEPSASLEPVLPPYPPLPPVADLVANQLISGDRELWRQEYVAVEGPAGTPSTTEIGPLDLAMGLGMVLACSGPSDVLVTMEASIPDSPITPLQAQCDTGETAGGQVPWWQGNVSATFVVTANTDTSWHLVIFDPAPE
jgi:hypothetical protein